MRLADEVYELTALRAPAVQPRPERDAAKLAAAAHRCMGVRSKTQMNKLP
ncbi:hypothetical protein ACVWZW_005230 [Bradyrhizobium sp. F1.13.4]